MAIATLPLDTLFGQSAIFDDTTGELTIQLNELAGSNSLFIQPGQITPTEIMAQIINNFHTVLLPLSSNQELLNDTELSVIAPASRNGIDRTLFSFTFGFYRGYSSPEFDPNEPSS